MKIGVVIALTLLAAALGVVVGLTIGGNREAASRTDGTEDVRRLEDENTELRDERERLIGELRLAEEAAEKAEREVEEFGRAAAPAEGAPAEPAVDPAASAVEEAAPDDGRRFFLDDYDGALRRVDWQAVGDNMSRMVPLIEGLVAQLARGESPDAETVGRISQLNGPLITAALKIQDKLPGTGVNGKFSSPPFMLNAISATLEAAEQPLTAGQAEAIERIARDFTDRDARRRDGYPEETFEMEKLLDEAEMKETFFSQVFARLSPQQVEVLSPEASRGRVQLDVFSASLVFSGRVDLAFYENADALAAQMLGKATAWLTLADEEREIARSVIEEWSRGLSRSLVDAESNLLDRQGLVLASRITAWGRQVLPLLKTLTVRLDLDEDRLNRVRRSGAVVVPVRTGG